MMTAVNGYLARHGLKIGTGAVPHSRGFVKNRNRLFSACALTNLLTATHHLMEVGGQTSA